MYRTCLDLIRGAFFRNFLVKLVPCKMIQADPPVAMKASLVWGGCRIDILAKLKGTNEKAEFFFLKIFEFF